LAAQKAGKEIAGALGPVGDVVKNLGSTFASMGGAVAGLTAVGGALFAAAGHAAEMGKQIFELHEKTGMSSESLSGLNAITRTVGGNFEEVGASLARMTVNFERTAEGGGKTNALLYKLMGGAQGAADLGLRPMNEQVQIMLQRIFALNDVYERNRALNQYVGKGWQSIVTVLKAFSESADQGAAAAKKLGLSFTDESAARAMAYTEQMNELKASIDGVSLSIGQKLIPSLSASIAGLNVWSQVWPHVGEELKDLAKMAFTPGSTGGPTAARADLETQKKAIEDLLSGAVKDAEDNTKKLAAGLALAGDASDGAAPKHEKHAKAVRGLGEGFRTVIPHVQTLGRALTELATSDWDSVIMNKARAIRDALSGIGPELVMPRTAEGVLGGPGGGGLFGMGAAPGAPAMGPEMQMPEGVAGTGIFGRTEMATPWSTWSTQIPRLVSTTKGQFQDLFKQMGKDATQITKQAFEGVADELAKLAVTGRANFRELFQGIAQEVIGSGLRDLFVGSENSSGNSGAAAGGLLGVLAKALSGGRAGGGPVQAGQSYLVGERSPEIFTPSQAGMISPSAVPMEHHTKVELHVHGVTDADSFRRSQGQVGAMVLNQLAIGYARYR